MNTIPYLGGKTDFFPDPNLKLLRDIIQPFDVATVPEIGIVGLPFDGGVVSHRRGARFAPKIIRDIMLECSTYNLDLEVDVENLNIADCGDVDVVTGDYDETHRRVELALTALFHKNMTMLVIGGDHSLSAPSIKALCNTLVGKKVGVIDFDTHYDIRSGWERNAGLWVREIQEIPGNAVLGKNIVEIGIHGFAYSKYYSDVVKNMGISVFKPTDVRKLGIEQVMEKAIEIASDGTDAIYVSVDIDVVDAPYAPGTNDAPHGGMMPWEVVQGIVQAAQHPLTRAIDVMEVAPPLDNNLITSNLGVEILMQFLGGLSLRKKRTTGVG